MKNNTHIQIFNIKFVHSKDSSNLHPIVDLDNMAKRYGDVMFNDR